MKYLFIRIYKAKRTFYSTNNKYYVRHTCDSVRLYPQVFSYFRSTFIQRKYVANPDQHSTATQGNATVLTPQVWKTLAAVTPALKPKDLPAFSRSSSFMTYCWCFLLRISGAPCTAQNTQAHPQRVEKYLLCLARRNVSPTSSSFGKRDLTATKRPSFKVHYLTRKTDDNQKNTQQEPRGFFRRSVPVATPTAHTPGGAGAPKSGTRCRPVASFPTISETSQYLRSHFSPLKVQIRLSFRCCTALTLYL